MTLAESHARRPRLTVDWCSHSAMCHACTNWHYSRNVPNGKLARFGVWEDGAFIGAIVYGRGSAIHIGRPFGLAQNEVAELARIALKEHRSFVSQAIAASLRLLQGHNPGLRLVVSFADSAQGHNGAIYQATNWVYLGESNKGVYRINGELVHPRTCHHRYGTGGQSIPWLRANIDPAAELVFLGAKHKYAMPLDREMKRTIALLAQPYPKVRGAARVEAKRGAPLVRAALPGFDALLTDFRAVSAATIPRLDILDADEQAQETAA
jgi:hypothetical protein